MANKAFNAETVTIQSPYEWCKTEIDISPTVRGGADYDAVVCIRSGAASLQTYATRAELRKLGELLLRFADENEVLEVAA